ncbi:MAG: hypothetical protein ACE15C_20470 [Phycisphaerae bacterium]
MREGTLKKLIIAASALALVLMALGLWRVFSGGGPPVDKRAEFTCDSCGNKWAQDVTDDPIMCPKCGGLGYATMWYICPDCRKPIALHVRMIAHMKTTSRLAGEKDWLPVCPPQITCPYCKSPFYVPQSPAGHGWAPPTPKAV